MPLELAALTANAKDVQALYAKGIYPHRVVPVPHVFVMAVSSMPLTQVQIDAVKRRLQTHIDKMQTILDQLAEKK